MTAHCTALHVTFGQSICGVEFYAVRLPWILLWIWRLKTLHHLQYHLSGYRCGPALVSADTRLHSTLQMHLAEALRICIEGEQHFSMFGVGNASHQTTKSHKQLLAAPMNFKVRLGPLICYVHKNSL